jgi:hypothetical protein
MPWFFRPYPTRPKPHLPSPHTGAPICDGGRRPHRVIHMKRCGNGVPKGSYALHARFVCPRCGDVTWRLLG